MYERLKMLPYYAGIGTGILAIFLFVILTGASSTAVRAGIMAILALVARGTGRTYDAARALLLAAALMVLWNPYILVYDVSFQLSFLATFAMIFMTPKFEKYFLWLKNKFLFEIATTTVAVYVFVLPFILYKMGNLSLVALPANLLILPFIPLTMGLSYLTGFLGLISQILAVPAGFVTTLLLTYELKIVEIFANFPLAAVAVPDFPLLLTISIYIYFIYLLWPTKSSVQSLPN